METATKFFSTELSTRNLNVGDSTKKDSHQNLSLQFGCS